jgi:type IV secretion system protein VirB3
MQDDYFDPIYKGCTAPSTAFGIPLLPFILFTMSFAQLALVGFFLFRLAAVIFVLILYLFAFVWARRISRNDEHRLLQYLIKMRMRGPQIASRKFWGAVSFSPLPSRK